jgi:hypothetical protein
LEDSEEVCKLTPKQISDKSVLRMDGKDKVFPVLHMKTGGNGGITPDILNLKTTRR